jgi:hypothetical protein
MCDAAWYRRPEIGFEQRDPDAIKTPRLRSLRRSLGCIEREPSIIKHARTPSLRVNRGFLADSSASASHGL